jgi:hypothetical protein
MTVRIRHELPRPQIALPGAPFNIWHSPAGAIWTEFHRQPDGYLLRFPGYADFHVSAEGDSVTAHPVGLTEDATVDHLFLNQVVPLALSRQGKLVLHASAVEIDGAAVAFLGPSGRGKSTLAASFATSGSRFLTDDGLQLEWRAGALFALPSHPSLRLWEDSEQALMSREIDTAPPVPFTPKSRFLAGNSLSFCDQAKPLRHCLYLGDGTASQVSIMPARDAGTVLELVRNSFLLDIDEQEMLARHFVEISRLANLPMHFHLDYPRRYDALAATRAAVLQHARSA